LLPALLVFVPCERRRHCRSDASLHRKGRRFVITAARVSRRCCRVRLATAMSIAVASTPLPPLRFVAVCPGSARSRRRLAEARRARAGTRREGCEGGERSGSRRRSPAPLSRTWGGRRRHARLRAPTSLAKPPKARPTAKPSAASNATSPAASGTYSSPPPSTDQLAPVQPLDIGAAKAEASPPSPGRSPAARLGTRQGGEVELHRRLSVLWPPDL
jgi:hypothetical protein